MNEVLVMIIIGLCGVALIGTGIYLLAGVAWTLIAGGLLCLFVASVIHRGVTRIG